MKLSQIDEKATNQNKTESNYLWNLDVNHTNQTKFRINLSTFTIDFSKKNPDPGSIKILMALPNNQFFGVKIWKNRQDYFISDENLNIKIIETSVITAPQSNFVSCFYYNSIFIHESYQYFDEWNGLDWVDPCIKRYSLSKDKWVALHYPQFFPDSCTGFGQKIIFAMKKATGLLIYDLFVNSYSQHLPIIKLDKTAKQAIIKNNGRIYLLIFSSLNGIYCSDDPLSEWNFLYPFREATVFRQHFCNSYYYISCYEGSVYYLKNSVIYKFELQKLKLKVVGEFKRTKLGQKIQRVKASINI